MEIPAFGRTYWGIPVWWVQIGEFLCGGSRLGNSSWVPENMRCRRMTHCKYLLYLVYYLVGNYAYPVCTLVSFVPKEEQVGRFSLVDL